MKRLLLCLAVLCALAAPVRAHEIGKTQATALFLSDGAYQVNVTVDPDALLTKLEVYGGRPISPAANRIDRDRRIEALANVFLEHVNIRFDGRLDQPTFSYSPASPLNDFAQTPSVVRLTGRVPFGTQDFTFANSLAMGSYALNVRIGDGPLQTVWLEGSNPSAAISVVAPQQPSTWHQIARTYFSLGYTHILPNGLDHILFVLGIFLLSARWRSILLQVSTFTVAHSITLGLTMYGLVSLPPRVVEPMIALSIAYVALENLFTAELKSWRLALVFSFGLLHGMGFAGVLRELGLPRSQFLTALVTFNLGVEAGQLSVIALALGSVAYWRANGMTYRRFIVQPVSLALALIGLYWTVQRALL